jgi:hypothetical protein
MKKLLQNDELEKQLIPDFAVGCKRVIPSGFRYLRVRAPSPNSLSL